MGSQTKYWKQTKWVSIWEAFVHTFWDEFFIKLTYKSIYTTTKISRTKTTIFANLYRFSARFSTRLWGCQLSHIRKYLLVLVFNTYILNMLLCTYFISNVLLRCAYVNYIYLNLLTSLVSFTHNCISMQCTLFCTNPCFCM